MGSIGPEAVAAAVASSDLHAKYAETIDRESAYEKLAAKIPPAAAPEAAPPAEAPPAPEKEKDEPGLIESAMKNPAVKSFMRSAASALGREITRGLFGNRKR
jgi:hypothetical protein